MPGEGEEGMDGLHDRNAGELVHVLAEACKETLFILSCLECCLKVWVYVVFRAGDMHRCIKTAGLRQGEEKNSPGGSCVVCLQICSVYFFSVGVNIHSSLLEKKKHVSILRQIYQLYF